MPLLRFVRTKEDTSPNLTVICVGEGYRGVGELLVARRRRDVSQDVRLLLPASIVVVKREPDLESDLVMRNLAVFDMAARLHHLEPADLAERARCTTDGVLDRVLKAPLRRACDLDDPVNMIRHRLPPVQDQPAQNALPLAAPGLAELRASSSANWS